MTSQPPHVDNICPVCEHVPIRRAPDGTWSVRTRARGFVLDESRLDDPAPWVTITDPEGDIGPIIICTKCKTPGRLDEKAIGRVLQKKNQHGDRRVRVPLLPVM